MTNSRAKGAAGERELSNILKQHGFKTRRGQQYCGANGDADVVGIDGIHIECKRVEALNIHKAMVQAKNDARVGEIPTVFHRKNRTGWLVTMELKDWIDMYKKSQHEEKTEYVEVTDELGEKQLKFKQ